VVDGGMASQGRTSRWLAGRAAVLRLAVVASHVSSMRPAAAPLSLQASPLQNFFSFYGFFFIAFSVQVNINHYNSYQVITNKTFKYTSKIIQKQK
jgi:hypothetical protein